MSIFTGDEEVCNIPAILVAKGTSIRGRDDPRGFFRSYISSIYASMAIFWKNLAYPDD